MKQQEELKWFRRRKATRLPGKTRAKAQKSATITAANVSPSDIKDDNPTATGTSSEGLGENAALQGLIYVHVTGQVAKPGLYGLPEGSRVHQAVEAAGGMTSKADRDSVNIALPISDGQQVFIPALKPQAPTITASKSSTAVAAEPKQATKTEETASVTQTAAAPEPQGRLDVTADKPEQPGVDPTAEDAILKVDINAAGQAELEQLPGIGPSTAIKIIEYRESNGPFTSIEGLMDVSGIGPAKFAAMKDMVVVR